MEEEAAKVEINPKTDVNNEEDESQTNNKEIIAESKLIEKPKEKAKKKKKSKRNKSSNKDNENKRNAKKNEWCKYFAFLNDEKREKLMQLPDINANTLNKNKNRSVKSKYQNASISSTKSGKKNSITSNISNSLNSFDFKSKLLNRDSSKSAPSKNNKMRNSSPLSSASLSKTSTFSSTESLNKEQHDKKNLEITSKNRKEKKKKNLIKNLKSENSDSDKNDEIAKEDIGLGKLKLRPSTSTTEPNRIRNKFDGPGKNFIEAMISSNKNSYKDYENQLSFFSKKRQQMEKSLSTIIKLDVDSSIEFNKIKQDISKFNSTVDFERVSNSLADKPTYKNLVRSMASNLNSYDRIKTHRTKKISYYVNADEDDDDLAINHLINPNVTNKLRTVIKSPYGGYFTNGDW